MGCLDGILAQAWREQQPRPSPTWCPVAIPRPRPCDPRRTREDAQGFSEQPPGGPWGDTLGPGPLPLTAAQPHSQTPRAPRRQSRQVPKPADWWGQQNHSLKQQIARGAKTSWVSASAHSTIPSRAHTSGVAKGLPRTPPAGMSSQHLPQASWHCPFIESPA